MRRLGQIQLLQPRQYLQIPISIQKRNGYLTKTRIGPKQRVSHHLGLFTQAVGSGAGLCWWLGVVTWPCCRGRVCKQEILGPIQRCILQFENLCIVVSIVHKKENIRTKGLRRDGLEPQPQSSPPVTCQCLGLVWCQALGPKQRVIHIFWVPLS